MNGLLTTAQAAERLGVSQSFLRGLPVAFVLLGKARRYDPADLDELIAASKRLPAVSIPSPRRRVIARTTFRKLEV